MFKKIIILMLALLIMGCGKTASSSNSDGGSNGSYTPPPDSRNMQPVTPITRTYGWNGAKTQITFVDKNNLADYTELALHRINISDTAINGIMIACPTGNAGRLMEVHIGNKEIHKSYIYTIPTDDQLDIWFYSTTGNNTTTEIYLDIAPLDQDNFYSWFMLMIDDVKTDYYYVDMFI